MIKTAARYFQINGGFLLFSVSRRTNLLQIETKSKRHLKMKHPLDNATRDIYEHPKFVGRGGDRGGRRTKANYQTKMFRADVRLSGIIETLKEKLKSGAINDDDLKTFEELVA